MKVEGLILEHSAVSDQASLVQGEGLGLDEWGKTMSDLMPEQERLSQLSVRVEYAAGGFMFSLHAPKQFSTSLFARAEADGLSLVLSEVESRDPKGEREDGVKLLSCGTLPPEHVLQWSDDLVVTEIRDSSKLSPDQFEISSKLAGPLD